jgi:glyoxylase-like metal-dependent hydrolase (beta-lactamase superfamily II)
MGAFTRRYLLRAGLAAVGATGLGGLPGRVRAAAAVRQTLPVGPIGVQALSQGLVLLDNAGGNVLALGSADAVTLVDGGLAGRSAALLKRVAGEFRGVPVRQLFNTHWHWDHSGSNEALAKSGAAIYAHENTRLWLGAQIDSKWEQRSYPPRPPRALPNHTFFYGSKTLDTGAAQLEYGYLPQAHTDGDLYVFSPQHNVLAAGDVVTGGSYPIVDYCTGGWLGGMVAGLKLLLGKVDNATRIVPGNGALRTKPDLQAQLEMCQAVLGRIGESYYKGETRDKFLAGGATRAFDARWGDPAIFLRTAYDGAWGHITEIRRAGR